MNRTGNVARIFMVTAALLGGLSVALGAFGAHVLKGSLSVRYLDVYNTAVEYQMIHALLLFSIALCVDKWPTSATIRWSGWAIIAGVVLFSGSLYLMVLLSIPMVGMLTPLGGVALIVGWLLLAVAALQYKQDSVA